MRMQGIIKHYSENSQAGIIKSTEGRDFLFKIIDVEIGRDSIKTGIQLEFEAAGGLAKKIEIHPVTEHMPLDVGQEEVQVIIKKPSFEELNSKSIETSQASAEIDQSNNNAAPNSILSEALTGWYRSADDKIWRGVIGGLGHKLVAKSPAYSQKEINIVKGLRLFCVLGSPYLIWPYLILGFFLKSVNTKNRVSASAIKNVNFKSTFIASAAEREFNSHVSRHKEIFQRWSYQTQGNSDQLNHELIFKYLQSQCEFNSSEIFEIKKKLTRINNKEKSQEAIDELWTAAVRAMFRTGKIVHDPNATPLGQLSNALGVMAGRKID